MKMLVRAFSCKRLLTLRMSSVSVCVSSAEVCRRDWSMLHATNPVNCEVLTASSKNRIGGSLRSTLATANRCFSPPESIKPRSPTLVWYFSGRRRIASCTCAFFAASYTSSSDAVSRPYRMFCSTSEWKRGVSCGTTPIALRRDWICKSRMSWPSTRIRPEEGS